MSDQGTGAEGGRDGSPPWSAPGEGTPDAGQETPLRFGESPAFSSSTPPATAGAPFEAPVAPSPLIAPPTSGGPPASPPGATPKKHLPTVVVALILIGALAFVALAGWFKVFVEGRNDDIGTSTYFSDGGVSTTFYSPGYGEPAPAVVVPPPDASTATVAIEELYQRVFTQSESTELWDQLITEPAGLREKIRPFGASVCAVGTETVVTEVQFTSDDTADVQLRFEGPNIPEIGRSYLFDGGAVRQPDGSWKATPEAVLHVASLANGYCG